MRIYRNIPYRYRIKLVEGLLFVLSRMRAVSWRRAEQGDAVKPGPLISGFFNQTFGIARAGKATLKAFQVAGFDVVEDNLEASLKDLMVGSCSLPSDQSGGVWLIHANAPEVLQALIAHSPKEWRDRYRIGYWAWETPKAPNDWAWVAQYLHEIWVPSRFVASALEKTFAEGGRPELSRRIRVRPHPIFDLDKARPDRAAFGLCDNRTEFICLFDAKSSLARKNPMSVLKAWHRAYPVASKTGRLTVKVSNLAYAPKIAEELNRYIAGREDIRLFTEHLDDARNNDFMASFDVLISLHRAEGFGLTLAEAMTLGVNVIATGWSGNTDFMDEMAGQLVPYRLVPIKDPSGVYEPVRVFSKADPDQLWADADIEAAAEAITKVSSDAAFRRQTASIAKRSILKVNEAWSSGALASLPFCNHLIQLL